MSKPKLTKAQNTALRGLKNLEEKLNLLHKWKKEGEITVETFNYFSNRWIRKETRKAFDEASIPNIPDRSHRRTRSVTEGEMKSFISTLRHRLNSFIAKRQDIELSDTDLAKLNKYLANFRYEHALVNELAILGLRFPDKRVSSMCADFIRRERMYPETPDFHFWCVLWEDLNLVPLDAIRLMLVKNDGKDCINPNLHPFLVRTLIPAISVQRDKEIARLKWAQKLEGDEHDREVARKTKRLNAFNKLLEAACAYII